MPTNSFNDPSNNPALCTTGADSDRNLVSPAANRRSGTNPSPAASAKKPESIRGRHDARIIRVQSVLCVPKWTNVAVKVTMKKARIARQPSQFGEIPVIRRLWQPFSSPRPSSSPTFLLVFHIIANAFSSDRKTCTRISIGNQAMMHLVFSWDGFAPLGNAGRNGIWPSRLYSFW
jgi:hypothetical protein